MVRQVLQFKLLVIMLLILVSTPLFGQNDFFKKVDIFLNHYVQSGRVDYEKIQENEAALHHLIEEIQSFPVSEQDATTQKAFWINAYILITIKTVVDHYPIESPLDFPGFFKQKNIAGTLSLSLDEIEKIKLLESFQDPRIHFAIVCAASDCSPIANHAYFPNMLDDQLDIQVSKAMDNPNFIRVDTLQKEINISEIFRWYKPDFDASGGVRPFINKYRSIPLPDNFKIKYYTFNWTLNDVDSNDNPERYRASALLKTKTIELKVFNSMYTERRFDGFEKFNSRSTYFSSFIQFLYGWNDKINLGADVVIKSNVVNDFASSFPLEVLNFRNFSTYKSIDCKDADNNISPFSNCKENGASRFDTLRQADGQVIQTSSAAGLAHIGPKIKFNPIKKWSSLSLQQTLYIPIQKKVDGQFISFTQLFYDKTIKDHSQFFVEASLWTPITPDFRVNPFFKVFYNYFPTNKWTIYAMTSVPLEIGAGTKYFLTPNLEIEFLYTYYLPIDHFLGDKRPVTFNIGFRYSNSN